MENPFKYGAPVDGGYFTDRQNELESIKGVLNSPNHLILISPRRFGKTSLIKKAVEVVGRPCVYVNVQMAATRGEFLSAVLREIYRLWPLARIRQFIKRFRVVPKATFNPATGEFEFSFERSDDTVTLFEDVFGLLESLSEEANRTIVVLDEFQDFLRLEKGIDKKLRGIIQMQKKLNYVFLGSEESLMTEIFMNVNSAFYRFGAILHLQKIPHDEFLHYLTDGLQPVASDQAQEIAEEILTFTNCHPHYTQLVAAQVWTVLSTEKDKTGGSSQELVHCVADHLSTGADALYDRLWETFGSTEKLVLRLLSQGKDFKSNREVAQSTIYSAAARLHKAGFVIKTTDYEIEDPVFSHWIRRRCEFRI